MLRASLLLLPLLVAARASAAPPADVTAQAEAPADAPADSAGRRAAAGATAVAPGLVVHGAGHFVRGETQTGWRLLAAEGIGLGSAVGGVAGLAGTGASPRTMPVFAWMMIHGVGLFGVSYLADIYGSVSGPDGSGRPLRRAPWLALELGHRFVYDPIFDYGHLAVVGAEWRHAFFALEARGLLAGDDDNQRLRVTPRFRLLGPRPDRPADDGGFLDLRSAVVWHRYGTERFSTTLLELAARGRLDLHHVGRTLRGAFAEAELGVATGASKHEGFDAEPEELLLGGFAFGLYLGHARDGWGEVALGYDHRHDGYAAGLKAVGLGSGVAGHFTVDARVGVYGPWGVGLEGAVGSAWLCGVSLLYRAGGER